MASDADDIDLPQGSVIVVNPGSWRSQVSALGHLLGVSARLGEGMRVIPDAGGRPPESTFTIASPCYWAEHLPELAEGLRNAVDGGATPPTSRVPASIGAVSETPMRLTWTVEEVAIALGISRAFAYDAVRRGDIPAIKIGRRILVPKSALAQLLKSSEQSEGGGATTL